MPGSDRDQPPGQRPCGHIPIAHPARLSSLDCRECLKRGDDWVELWRCLSCGWVACSDDSPNQHAKAHYEETDHPVAVPLRVLPSPRWCYVHQRLV
jgi:uncharacterized UBP type Zn finger protein